MSWPWNGSTKYISTGGFFLRSVEIVRIVRIVNFVNHINDNNAINLSSDFSR